MLWIFIIPEFGLFAFAGPSLAEEGHNAFGGQVLAGVDFLGEVFAERGMNGSPKG